MRIVAAVLLTSLCLVSLTGCWMESKPPGEPEAAKEPVKITMWNLLTNDARQIEMAESIARFNRSQAGIQVVPYYFENEAYKNKLRVALVSNNMPDIFYFWFGESFKRMVDSQVVADLTDEMQADSVLRGNLMPEALRSVTYYDRLYAIPHSIQHVVIWYSKPMFESMGLPIPTTWNELSDAVKAFNKQGIPPIAVAGKDRWPLLHWYSYLAHRLGGSEPFKRAAKGIGDFEEPSFVEAALLFHRFVKDKAFAPGFLGMDEPTAEQKFLRGETAMYMQGDWAAGRLMASDKANGQIGYFRFPTVNGKGSLTEYQGGYAVGWAVSKSADIAAAFRALSFLMSPAERKRYVEVSGTPSTLQTLDVSKERMNPAVDEYIRFIEKDAADFFTFFDQDIDHRRAQLLLDAVMTFAGEHELGKEEIEEVLRGIR